MNKSARDLYYRPDTAFVAGFVGDTNRWRGRVSRVDGTGLSLETASGVTLLGAANADPLTVGDSADIFVRPEAIRMGHSQDELARFENRFSGTVTSLLFNGAASRVLVAVEGGTEEIEVNLPQSGEFASLTKGSKVHIGWANDQANCFAAGGA